MKTTALVVIAVVSFVTPTWGQSKTSIQGVWRQVEITATSPTTPPGGFSKGTHANVQPGFKVTGKPTAEEMQAQWSPFQAGAGTYEWSGTTLTTTVLVARNPALQAKDLIRYTVKLDGQNLWVTAVENTQGKIEYPVTIKFARAECSGGGHE